MPSRRVVLTSSAAAAAAWAASAAAPAFAADPPAGRARGVSFNVISDIQGDTADFATALQDMARTNPASAGLAVVGDITSRGYDFEYAAVRQVVDRGPVPSTIAWAIGNHEFYVPKYRSPDQLAQDTWPNGTTEESLFRSFYAFTGRDKVYAEHSFGGVPVLVLGTERYLRYHDTTKWDEVWISDTQFAWLEERLAHWARRRQPVMVCSHHVLPNTVSGTRNKLYLNDYLDADRLLGILGRYPDVFLFTGHTHWDLALSDWYVRRVVEGADNLSGFHVVNTGAIETGWRDNGTGGETAVSGPFAQGLQVEVNQRWVTVRARDFINRRWIREVRIPLSTTN
ncbi:phosphohydrolase [Enemella evansiae]|uniref:Phosphohydrolase n=1 Tax=Enemella evansiae TaxID=2016499 RepID=A0A255GFI6_9ACTN|nr:DUF4073 domain-containing protein [Enemella evansiae]OYN92979.1 phosphohydrolase [Enemella evansiae]OYN94721.1 phosphohydrolase [Enemella evansiae]OYO14607.1 phosphohydrolase [Enemella evansiae]